MKITKFIIALTVCWNLPTYSNARENAKPEPGAVAPKPEVGKPAPKRFPPHWGEPPAIQTRDIRPLPGGFGMGSSTLASWIEKNLKSDAEKRETGQGGTGEKPKPGNPNKKPETGGPDPKPEKPDLEGKRPRPFPPHWGKPPALQTKDLRPLPGGFGMGSSTLAAWIDRNIKADLANKDKPTRPSARTSAP